MKEGYKTTPIVEIPEDWEVVKLYQKCIKITDGSHFSPKPIKEDTDFFIATVKDMLSHTFNRKSIVNISEEDYIKLLSTGCKPDTNDVLFSKDGTIGKTFVYKEEYNLVLLSSIAIIRPNLDELDPYFLCQVLQSSLFYDQLEGLKSGSAIRRLVLKSIKEIKCIVPPLPEQQKIAEILSTVDEKIEVIEEQISQTQTLKKGLMQRLLTKGIGHTQFKPSPLGEIPESWEVIEFIDALTLQRGFDLPVQKRRKGKYPLIASNGGIDSHDEYKVIGPAIITGRSGTIGKVYFEEQNCWPLNTTLYVKEMNGNHPKFLFYFLQFQNLDRYSTGTGVPTLNRNVVHKQRISIPTKLEEQREIANILSTVDGKLDVLAEKKQQYQELKKGLMQQLLTGKIRVNQLMERAGTKQVDEVALMSQPSLAEDWLHPDDEDYDNL